MTILTIAALAVLGLVLFVLFWFVLPALWGYQGKRIVTCPETGETVTVKVDASRAALDTVRPGIRHLQLTQCTHWPEREECAQLCVGQIEANPEGCFWQTILTHWYEGKRCRVCDKPFETVHWHDHKPAVMDLEGRIKTWEDMPPEKLVDGLQHFSPVCWDCQVAENFRQKYPDLVTDRDWKH